MSTATAPALREVILDALEDAYWSRLGAIACCPDCIAQPAGICPEHRADNAAARTYEEARKQLQHQPGHPEVLAVLAGIEGGE